MNLRIFLAFSVLIIVFSCKDDPTGPGMGCHLNDLYVQDNHFVKAAKVFDIRTDPPTEIRNDSIEYQLATELILHFDDIPQPAQYAEYFIDSIEILGPGTIEVHIFESENSRNYTYTRDDCGMDLTSPEGNLHLELVNGGDELNEQRFAIYNHRRKRITFNNTSFLTDTFSFLEFRLGPFSSYREIITQFAKDNPGLYDTVAVELVQNKTRE